MKGPEQRHLRLLKRQLQSMRNAKQKLSVYLVVSLFLISVLVVLLDLLCVSGGESYSSLNMNGSSDEDSKGWETAPPLDTIPWYRRNLRLYSSSLDSDRTKFRESLVARQEEMQQLMRNISASMSKNPLVRQIQASRAEYRYRTAASLSMDP